MKVKGILLLLLINSSIVFGNNTYSLKEIYYGTSMDADTIPKVANDTISIDTDELLQINSIDITAMKITGGGKFTPTKSARRTDVMRINFQIENNKYISPGYKDVYILVQNPKGVILNRKGTFDVYGGRKLRYTAKTEAYYENNYLKISILTDKIIQKMTKGMYTVIIYIENYPVGLEVIKLR